VCRAVSLLHATGCDTHNHPTSASSGDFSRTPFVSNSPLRVVWIKCPVATAKTTFAVAGSMTIFGHAWGLSQRPLTSLDPKLWCYITRRFGSLGGHSWSSLAAAIAVRIHRQNFFVWLKSLTSPVYLIVRCFIYHHSAVHQLTF